MYCSKKQLRKLIRERVKAVVEQPPFRPTPPKPGTFSTPQAQATAQTTARQQPSRLVSPHSTYTGVPPVDTSNWSNQQWWDFAKNARQRPADTQKHLDLPKIPQQPGGDFAIGAADLAALPRDTFHDKIAPASHVYDPPNPASSFSGPYTPAPRGGTQPPTPVSQIIDPNKTSTRGRAPPVEDPETTEPIDYSRRYTDPNVEKFRK